MSPIGISKGKETCSGGGAQDLIYRGGGTSEDEDSYNKDEDLKMKTSPEEQHLCIGSSDKKKGPGRSIN